MTDGFLMTGWRERRFSTTRVSTRLVAIVLVPLIGLAVSARAEAMSRWRVADEAEDLKAEVEQVSTMLPMGLQLSREVFFVGAQSVGAQRGLSPSIVDLLLGLDVDESLRVLRQDTSRRFAQLPSGNSLLQYRDDVESTRRDLARGDLTIDEAATRLTALAGDANAAAFDALNALEGRKGSDGRELHVLRAASDAASTAFDQVALLIPLVVTEDTDPAARLDELRVALAEGVVAQRELERIATGAVQQELERFRRDARIRESADDIVSLSHARADALPRLAPPELAGLFSRAVDRLSGYYELVEVAARDAADAAQETRDHAMGRLRNTLLATALLFSLTVLITFLIARTIALPLRRLAAGAENVRAGQLDVRLPRRGPREFTAVTETLDEVVGNLRLVESHVGALAAGDLEHPALSEQVPGRLGKLLHDSVTRLSRSMFEKQELADRLRHEATHDALTGLPNRSAAARHLDSVLALAGSSGTPIAVLYVDLDGFKQVNDAYGHETGDIVLRVAGERLVRAVRNGDLVARIGGDEFLVITAGVSDPRVLTNLGARLIEDVSAPITAGAVTIRVGASVGVALSGDGSADADALLRDADLAGYEAKAAGRGRVELFDEELRNEVRKADEIHRALRDALAGDELMLYYQPVFDVATGRPVAFEALLRWNRPGVGFVSPGEFIPVAEASDLIVDVDRWVLDRACAQLAAWREDAVLGRLPIAVNLSGRHLLNLTCVDDVRTALRRHDVEPGRLRIEVTETVLLVDVALTAEHLGALRALGVGVAIDDFGTGYTSLTHLGALPADVLKIDISLVRGSVAARQAEVVALLIGTAHALALTVTAEGVETPEEFERMRAMGCDHIQGFYLATPVAPEALTEQLRPAAAVL